MRRLLFGFLAPTFVTVTILLCALQQKFEQRCAENLNLPTQKKCPYHERETPLNVIDGLQMNQPLVFDETETENQILNNAAIQMDDFGLIEMIRRKFILPPSNLQYNFNNKKLSTEDINPSYGAVQSVAHILKTMTDDPFYLECGANDGEWGSNSIWLEKMGWTGLLIEADTITFQRLQTKNRKAYTGNFCLSNLKHPAIVKFYQDERGNMTDRLGSSLIQSQQRHALEPTPVHCFPLYSVLLAMNRTTVDFFSLDIEGSELDILMTVPFQSVVFKVITIEKIWVHQGEKALKQFMLDQGYLHFADVFQDKIFVHPSVLIK